MVCSLEAPSGIAVDSLDNVYVADTGNRRIKRFDSNGTFLLEWGSLGIGDGQFGFPGTVAVDSFDNVYVAADNRIQKFDINGAFLLKWGSFGTGDGQFDEPVGIAVDSLDNVYVADFRNSRIQKFGSAQDAVTTLVGQVQDLIDDDVLNGGNGNALISKLDNAIKKLDQGQPGPAVNQLEAFINQVQAFLNSGKLTAEQGQPLIDAAQRIIDTVSS